MSNCNDISACRKCAQAVSSAAFWTRGSECISKKSLFLQRQNIGVLFGFFCTNTILKLIQNIFSTLALLAHALHRVKKKRKKKGEKKKRPLTGSLHLLIYTSRAAASLALQFLSLVLQGRNRNMKALAYRKETHGSLILKWFRSQVERVK